MPARTWIAMVAAVGMVAAVVAVGDVVSPAPAQALTTLPMHGVGEMPPIDGGDERARVAVTIDQVALLATDAATDTAADLATATDASDGAVTANDEQLVDDLAAAGWGVRPGTPLPRPRTLAPARDVSDLVALDTAVEAALLDLVTDLDGVTRVAGTTYEVVGSGSDPAALRARLSDVPGVLAVAPVTLQRPLVTNDELVDHQWGLENTGQVVRDRTGTPGVDVGLVETMAQVDGDGVVVAVIDSGVEFSHPDLAGRSWRNEDEDCGDGRDDDGNGYVDDCAGWDFVNGDGTVDDAGVDDRHGTHVAGIVAAGTDDAVGVASLAPGATIMSLKVFQGGSAPDTRITAAIDYAVRNGADVINMSLGGPGSSATQRDALDRARRAGVLVVVAAGNDGTDNDVRPIYPASYDLDNIVAVGSIAADGAVSRFSNVGARSVDVLAPGEQILSTLPGGGWGYLSGTSMAAPMVTAVAATTAQSWATTDAGRLRRLLLDATEPDDRYAGRVATDGRIHAPYALSGTTFLGQLSMEASGLAGSAPGAIEAGLHAHLRGADTAGVELQLVLGRLWEGAVHAVVDHPVTVGLGDGAPTAGTTDATGTVPLPALADADRTSLAGAILDIGLATSLPAGRYVLALGGTTDDGTVLRPVAVHVELADPSDPPAPTDGGATGGGGDGDAGRTGDGVADGGGTDADGTRGTGGTGGTIDVGGTVGGGGTGRSGSDGGSITIDGRTGGGNGGTTSDGGTGGGWSDGITIDGWPGDGVGTGGGDGGTTIDGVTGDAGGTGGTGGTGDGGDGTAAKAVRPDRGPDTGGTWVVVMGTFDTAATYYVHVGDVVHRPVVVAPWALGFITAPGPAGRLDVTVHGGPDGAVTHASAFTYESTAGGGGGGTGSDGGGSVGGGSAPAPDGTVGTDGGTGSGGADDGGTTTGPGVGGGTDVDAPARPAGLEATRTAGEPFTTDDGLTLDLVVAGPLAAVGPDAWRDRGCTSDPCPAHPSG